MFEGTKRGTSQIRTAVMVIGMAFYWPLLRKNMLFLLFAGHGATDSEMPYWHAAFLAVAFILTLIFVIKSNLLGYIQNHTKTLLAIFAAKAATKTVLLVGLLQGSGATALTVLDVTLSAVVYVLLGLMWATRLVQTDLHIKDGAKIALLSFLLSFLLQRAIATSDYLVWISAAVIPLISAICWYMGRSIRKDPFDETRSDSASRSSGYRPSTFIILLIIFLFAGSIIRGIYVITPEISPVGTLTQDLSSIIFALLIFSASFFLSFNTKLIQILWSVLTVVFFAGLFFMIVVNSNDYQGGQQFVIVARTFLCFLLMVALVNSVRRDKASPVKAFALFFLLVDITSSFVGYIVAPVLFDMSGASLEGISIYLIAAIAFVLIVACVVFSSNRLTKTVSQTEKAMETVNPDNEERLIRFKATCRSRGLTTKEVIVASLLSQGYSQRKISEMTYVTVGTTQTHIKSIYRKFNIHSKQDLISLVNQRDTETNS